MKFAYAPFSRPLREPFRYGNQTITNREGFLLSDGTHFSEASPLPGHSLDSLPLVKKALQDTASLEARDSLPASLRFALDGLAAQKKAGKFPVRTNALLPWRGIENSRSDLRDLFGRGFRTFKLKISHASWEQQFELLREFPEANFRLDANQSLHPDDLEKIGAAIERMSLKGRIEYLEEPFKEIWQAPAWQSFSVPLAADESAPGLDAARALCAAPNSPQVIVVKPTVWGGLSSLESGLCELARGGKKLVLTSSLEAEAGRRSILAYLSQNESCVSGLSTGFLFARDFLGDRAEWDEVPAISAAERDFIDSLSWKDHQ